jgi:xylulokinase
MTAFVGLDVGTSGTKALVMDRRGRVLACAERSHETTHPQPGFSEQDPEDWVRSAMQALHDLGEARPAGLACSGQMHGLVLLDGRGSVLRPAILWNDGRAAAQRAEIEELVGTSRLLSLVANRPMPGFTAPSLLWVRGHEPEIWEQVRKLMLPKDYVRWRIMGGDPVTDVSDASGTLLFDVRRRRWSAEVLDALELDHTLLPDVVECVAGVGASSDSTAVVAGAGDQAAAALGVGLQANGPIGISVGTSGVLAQLRSTPPAAEVDGRLQELCAYSSEMWQTMGVTLAAGGSLAWWQGCCGEVSTELLLAEAEAWPPGCEGLTFLPYISGERAPHHDERIRGSFAGLAAHHDRGALTRAVIEGVACSLADVLGLMQSSRLTATARLSGGLAKSRLVREIIASVTGLTLELTGVLDSAAYGAALLAGVAAHEFADVHEAAAIPDGFEVTEPVCADRDAYVELRARYRGLSGELAASSPMSVADERRW